MDLPADVARGDQVTGGQRVGSVGRTGNAQGTSPHLHFSITQDGNPINPTEFLRGGEVAPPLEDPADEALATAPMPAQVFRGYTSQDLRGYLGFDLSGQSADQVLNPISQQPGAAGNIFGRETTPKQQGAVATLDDEFAAAAEELALVDASQGVMDMAKFMAGIRTVESGSADGNYGARNAGSGAFGAYQMLERFFPDFMRNAAGYWDGREDKVDWSWGNISNRAVQDQVARGVYEHFFNEYDGNWALMATAWHAGPGTVRKIQKAAGGKDWADITIADIEAGHRGESKYVNSVLGLS
jgi:hypothetical protein